jgi:hypothetical protein
MTPGSDAVIPGSGSRPRIGRVLDWALGSAIGFGVLLSLLRAAAAVYHRALIPFPTFGDDLGRAQNRVLIGFACLWLAWAISIWVRAVRQRWPGVNLIYLVSLLATFGGYLTFYLGLPALNALADFSTKVVTPIYVQDTFKHGTRNARGGGISSAYARVNRRDHPDEEVVIDWGSCDLPAGVAPSPFAEIELGRGAVGVAWFSLPIHCRPLQIGDRPLYGGVFLGRGQPLVVITTEDAAPISPERSKKRDDILSGLKGIAEGRFRLPRLEADVVIDEAIGVFFDNELGELRKILSGLPDGSAAREMAIGRQGLAYAQDVLLKHDSQQLARLWVRAILGQSADLDIAIVHPPEAPPPVIGEGCARCRVLSLSAIHPQVLHLFLRGRETGGDVEHGNEHVYLADARGRRVFDARLSEVDKVSRLLDRIAGSKP